MRFSLEAAARFAGLTAFWIAILGFARFARRTPGFMLPCATRTLTRGLSFLIQLPNPLLQELPLRLLLGQGQSFLITRPGLSGPARPAIHICAGCMRPVIVCQFAMFQQRVDLRQTGR